MVMGLNHWSGGHIIVSSCVSSGILPAPRKFLKWSSDLEPAGKKREAAMAKQPVKGERHNVLSCVNVD